MSDNSNQIIDDIKWFMFNDHCDVKNVVNEFGFNHELTFEEWAGDQHSFIVTDANGDKYRVMVTKEDV